MRLPSTGGLSFSACLWRAVGVRADWSWVSSIHTVVSFKPVLGRAREATGLAFVFERVFRELYSKVGGALKARVLPRKLIDQLLAECAEFFSEEILVAMFLLVMHVDSTADVYEAVCNKRVIAVILCAGRVTDERQWKESFIFNSG